MGEPGCLPKNLLTNDVAESVKSTMNPATNHLTGANSFQFSKSVTGIDESINSFHF